MAMEGEKKRPVWVFQVERKIRIYARGDMENWSMKGEAHSWSTREEILLGQNGKWLTIANLKREPSMV